jgi:glycosyltransferase involved in cell wall biosynthesis
VGTKVTSNPFIARRRIGINAHLLAQEESHRRAGISRYIHNLLLHLYRTDPESDYTVFLNNRCTLTLPYRQRHSRLPTRNPWWRIFWEQCVQPLEVRTAGIQLLHSPVNVQPLFLPCGSVVTVMDLSFMVFPETLRTPQRFYQRVFTRWSAQRANHLIAISNRTARDLNQFFAVPADRVSVVFPGVDTAHRPIKDEAKINHFRQRHSLPERFILFIGTLEPRKNLLTLLEAYAEFRRQTHTGHKLVLGGAPGWFYQPVLAAVEDLGLGTDVMFPGFIPDDELPLWYNAADVFVYPSLYEGFGLPPLEAMACGTPVIVSSASSLPEVVGDAALLASPHKPEEWAMALSSLCNDAGLRNALATRGPQRAQQFSWKRTARETAKVYRTVISGDR